LPAARVIGISCGVQKGKKNSRRLLHEGVGVKHRTRMWGGDLTDDKGTRLVPLLPPSVGAVMVTSCKKVGKVTNFFN